MRVLEEVDGPIDTPGAAPSPGYPAPVPSTGPEVPTLPDDELAPGGGRVFGGNRLLVAYYGTAQTGAMGVLGESPPDVMTARLRRAAEPFLRPGQTVQPVYGLIVTVADATAGPNGDFSHDIPRPEVERYVRAAERNDALLLLDIQPGRAGFLSSAKRWEWALREPHVGLTLDPEWRMGRREVPGRVTGSVTAAEVNHTSAWLAKLVKQRGLPQKLFVLHQFRTAMVEGIERVSQRAGLAMVQHADGFGTRDQKLATYRAIARPDQFTMGLKLFYDEDVNLIDPAYLHQLRPRVRFISFQ